MNQITSGNIHHETINCKSTLDNQLTDSDKGKKSTNAMVVESGLDGSRGINGYGCDVSNIPIESASLEVSTNKFDTGRNNSTADSTNPDLSANSNGLFVNNDNDKNIEQQHCTTRTNDPQVEHPSDLNNKPTNQVAELTSKLKDTVNLSSNMLESESEMAGDISYVVYESEKQMPDIMRLIGKDLSEPYSIYTYRYFIHNWPKLCFLAMDGDLCIGAIVCKLEMHKKMAMRGYIAMLAVDSGYRRRKLGSTLVRKAIQAMIRDDCDEVVLETEITNQAALHLYENLGFVRDKRLFRYYLNGVDALRLKLWLR